MRSVLFFAFVLLAAVAVKVRAQTDDDHDILAPGATEGGSVALNGWHCYDVPIQRTLDQNGDWVEGRAYRIIIILRRNSPASNFQLYASADGRTPTQSKYDYANLVSAASQTLIIEGLDVYEDILTTCVFGKTAGSFTIFAQLVVITPLAIHGATSIIIDAGRWAYFAYNLTSTDDSQYLYVGASGASNNIVVRLSQDDVPNIYFADVHSPSNVSIYFPSTGMWYIALENTGTSRYQGTLTVTTKDVETLQFVTDTPVALNMLDGQERFFYYDVQGISKPKMMTVHVDVDAGDPDVYIKENSLPHAGNYDFHDASWNDEFELHILVQENTRYYFGIVCYDDCEFTIEVSMSDFSVTKAANNTIFNQPATEDWIYAEVEVPDNSNFLWQITVEVNATEGDPDIYLRYNKLPSTHDTDARDWSTNVHSSVSVVNAKPGKWYIGIEPAQGDQVAYRWKVLIIPMEILSAQPGVQYSGQLADDWDSNNNLVYISVPTGNAGDSALLSVTVTSTLPPLDGSDYYYDDEDDRWNEITISGEYNTVPQDLWWGADELYVHSHSGRATLTIPQPNGTWYFIIALSEGASYNLEVQLANAKALGCDAMTDSGVTGAYNFYFYDLDHLFYLQAQLDSLSTSGNAEIYVAHGYLPGRLNSEFSMIGSGTSKQLQVPPTQQGRLYIAVYITSSLTYTISACKLDLDLPVLTPGVTISDSLQPNQWKYYYIDFGPSSGDLISLTLKGSNGSPNAYIQEGEFPTEDSNLAYVSTSSSKAMLFLFDPPVDRYYVGLNLDYYDDPTNYTVLPSIAFKDDLAKPLKSLDVATGSVAGGSWVFYSVYVGNVSSPFYIVMTSIVGDPDVYVSYGHMPSTSNSTYRSTTSRERSIIAMKPTIGFWYIGIRGFSSQNQYSMYVRYGDTRSAVAIGNGNQVTASISGAVWKDYSIQVSYGSMLVIQVIGSNNPITVYIRYGDVPDAATYTKKQTITSGNIYVTDVQYGTYYVSVRGPDNTKFTLSPFFGGRCFSPSCVCASVGCNSQTTAASSGIVYNGLIDEGYWNHYMLNVDAGYFDLSLAFQTRFATKDKIYCYVKYGSPPTNTSYDYITGLDPGQRQVQVMDVPTGILYFSIYGASVAQYGTYSVQVNLTQYGSCPNHCSGHGSCVGGSCVCDSQWISPDCSTYASTLNADQPYQLTGHLRPNTYNYFTVVGNENSASTNLFLQAILTSSQSTGKIQLFASLNGVSPSSSSHDVASIDSTNATLTIRKMSKQKKVMVALYCVQSPVDYSISSFPVIPEHSAGKIVMTFFIVLIVIAILGGGFYYLRKNPGVIKPFGSLVKKRTQRRRTEATNRLFDEEEPEDVETQDSTASSDFASALSKATEDDDADLFDSIRSSDAATTTTTATPQVVESPTVATTTTTTTTNLLDL